jgi:hypothetical protein
VKRLLLTATLALLVAGLGILGCSRPPADNEEDIRALLASSGYTSDKQTTAYGSDDSTPTSGGGGDLGPGADGYDTIPFVRFRRFVPQGGVSKNINVQIPAYPGYPDTTALATITADINGELRTLYDTASNPWHVWRKPFHDQAVRKVYLTRDANGWYIRKVSPMNFTTVGAAYSLRLVNIHAVAASGEVFDLATADTLLSKDELPTFVPGDTVTVGITVESTGDSCWVFLHHGRPNDPEHRYRRPYFKTDTYTFERTWYLGTEGYDVPEVRPSAHDAIGWNSLWADTTQPYVSNAWGVPYIVKYASEPMPDDE